MAAGWWQRIYSQIELRVIASMAADEAMMQAFRNDEDIHARTAKEIFGLSSLEEVDRDQTSQSQGSKFRYWGPYGVSAFGLGSTTRNKG